ncbi:hypothetical protein KSF_042960 [Reticulibacter mediterranei]|uniref:Uncharacterized protein n=1 Tax=Reticulibacter mediterranei TaxID=2778369 RepID=A0A8J3IIH5_9CHLR|nr:hypothetical protein KSF_042960 [Reticulibacter mediterranei]
MGGFAFERLKLNLQASVARIDRVTMDRFATERLKAVINSTDRWLTDVTMGCFAAERLLNQEAQKRCRSSSERFKADQARSARHALLALACPLINGNAKQTSAFFGRLNHVSSDFGLSQMICMFLIKTPSQYICNSLYILCSFYG